MNNFEYYNPVRVIFGAGELKRIGKEAKAFGSRVALVSYKDLNVLAPLIDSIQALLEADGAIVFRFCEAEPNPEIETIKSGVEFCKHNRVELIIGIGGGSAMDAAKAIAAGVFYGGDLWNMVYSRHDHVEATPPTKALPTIMVPTLPATGSEMNQCAVLSNRKLAEKSYIWGTCLYPKVAIIDPSLTLSLPAQQTASAAADTISHVLEIYLNGEDDSDLQHYFQEGVMRTVIDNIEKVLKDPTDISARSHLQWAATCAINGWASPGDAWTPIHQIGHVLTSRHKVSHGDSLAILMPAWMKHRWRTRPDQYFRFAKNVMQIDITRKTKEVVILEGIAAFKEFLLRIGTPTSLQDMNITSEDFSPIITDVVKVSFNAQGVLFANPPATKEDIKQVLELAY